METYPVPVISVYTNTATSPGAQGKNYQRPEQEVMRVEQVPPRFTDLIVKIILLNNGNKIILLNKGNRSTKMTSLKTWLESRATDEKVPQSLPCKWLFCLENCFQIAKPD